MKYLKLIKETFLDVFEGLFVTAAFDVQEKVKMEREDLIFPLDEDIQVLNDKLDRMMISV